MTAANAKDRLIKSTNVRMCTIGLALRGLSALRADWGAALLERLFLTARRRPAPSREVDWLAGSRRQEVTSGAHRVVCWTWGRGPTVLLVHGWEGRGSQLGAFVEPLVAAGLRVVALDAPGHGGSTGRRSSLVEMADAVLDTARALGPVRAVVAHSAGAAATTIALARGLRPERAAFVSPAADPGRFLYEISAAIGLPREVADRTRWRIEERFGVEWSSLRPESLARDLVMPLLIVHDERDREVPVADGVRLANAWRASYLLTTNGLGHRRILRAPEVVAAVSGFVADGSPPTGRLGRRAAATATGLDRGAFETGEQDEDALAGSELAVAREPEQAGEAGGAGRVDRHAGRVPGDAVGPAELVVVDDQRMPAGLEHPAHHGAPVVDLVVEDPAGDAPRRPSPRAT